MKTNDTELYVLRPDYDAPIVRVSLIDGGMGKVRGDSSPTAAID